MLTKKLSNRGVYILNGKIVWEIGPHKITLRNTAENVNKLNQFVERVESRLGRELTRDEIYDGLPHVEDRPLRERINQDGRNTIADRGMLTEKVNGYRISRPEDGKSRADHLRDALRDHHAVRAKSTFDAHMNAQILEAEVQEQLAKEAAEREAESDSRVTHASFGFLELMYSNAPQSEIGHAAQRLEVARNGSAKDYAAADADYRQRQEMAALNAKMAAEQQFAQAVDNHQKQTSALQSAAWTETPTEQS